MILHSTLANRLPTVSVRTSRGSSKLLMVHPGEASVCPNTEMICFMFITSAAFRISSGGQLAPAMIPVRTWEKSVDAKSGWFIIAMNMVGTPLKVVIRS